MRTIVALTTCICMLGGTSGVFGQALTPNALPSATPSAPAPTPSPPPLAPTVPPPLAPTVPPPLTPTVPPPLAPTVPPPLAPTVPPPVAPSVPPAPTNQPGAVTTLGTFSVGNWSAGAYSAPGSMNFDHCAAQAPYQNGITLGFAVTRTYQWSMAFYNPAWKLTPGASYPISFTIDYSQPGTAIAIAFNVNAVDVPLAPDVALFKRFMEGNQLRVIAASESFLFDLTDTARLLPDLLNCVKSYVGAAPPSSNPFQSFSRP